MAPARLLALCGEGSEKGQGPLAGRKLSPTSLLDAGHFSSLFATAFQASMPVLELRRSVLQPEVRGTYHPCTGTLGRRVWCGAGTPCSEDILPKYLSTTHGCKTSPLTRSDGCGFFFHSCQISIQLSFW